MQGFRYFFWGLRDIDFYANTEPSWSFLKFYVLVSAISLWNQLAILCFCQILKIRMIEYDGDKVLQAGNIEFPDNENPQVLYVISSWLHAPWLVKQRITRFYDISANCSWKKTQAFREHIGVSSFNRSLTAFFSWWTWSYC